MIQSSIRSWLVVIATAVFGHRVRQADACSCIAIDFPTKFDNSESVDAVYIYGQMSLINDRFYWKNPDEPVEDINADIYYYAYVWKSYKGCKGHEGQSIVISSGGNSGLCGVNYNPGGWYIISSYEDSNNPYFNRVNSCGINIAWEDIASNYYDDYLYADSNVEVCGGAAP